MEEIILKKWFSAEPFVRKFCNFQERGEQTAFAEKLGVNSGRLSTIMQPGYLMSANMADRYAIKLRISPSRNMV